MNTRFTLQHCGNPLESLLSDYEDNIIFRASIIGAGPYSIKKTYYDWLSAEVHDEYKFSLHKITLIGKSMVDFNESNPGLLGYASTEEEADQFLKREIDKAYLLA